MCLSLPLLGGLALEQQHLRFCPCERPPQPLDASFRQTKLMIFAPLRPRWDRETIRARHMTPDIAAPDPNDHRMVHPVPTRDGAWPLAVRDRPEDFRDVL